MTDGFYPYFCNMKIKLVILCSCLLLYSCESRSTVCKEGELKGFAGKGEKVTVTAMLTQYAYERKDGDIHLVLKDTDSGCTLVAEITFADSALWMAFNRKYDPTEAPKYPHQMVTVSGIRFYDTEHGVTGAAPNEVEIHPVLKFKALE